MELQLCVDPESVQVSDVGPMFPGRNVVLVRTVKTSVELPGAESALTINLFRVQLFGTITICAAVSIAVGPVL